MHHKATNDELDSKAASVLNLLIDCHPGLLHVEEVIRDIAADSSAFADRDEVDIALRDLVRVGLLHRHGDFVFATRAASHADRLHF